MLAATVHPLNGLDLFSFPRTNGEPFFTKNQNFSSSKIIFQLCSNIICLNSIVLHHLSLIRQCNIFKIILSNEYHLIAWWHGDDESFNKAREEKKKQIKKGRDKTDHDSCIEAKTNRHYVPLLYLKSPMTTNGQKLKGAIRFVNHIFVLW